MRTVYAHDAVIRVRRLQHAVLASYPSDGTVRQLLARQASTLAAAHARGDAAATIQPSQWLPRCVGRPESEILAQPLTEDDARLTVAREHGFVDWETVEKRGNVPLDAGFETAVDAALAGDIDDLGGCLTKSPSLLHARSAYGHRATLLHYLAANGVETWRQVVPDNAADVVGLLIALGADVRATMPVYGGHHTTLELVRTSAHPAVAGVLSAMVEALSSTGDRA